MVSQQTCPSCATANSTFASVCRNCAAPLAPRPLPVSGPGGFAVYSSGGAPAAPPVVAPPPPSPDSYQAAPRSATGDEGGWPADRISPSRFQASASDGWTGVPREQATAAQQHAPPAWGPPAAPPPQRSDGHRLAGASPDPTAAAPAPRGPLAFHLDVGAGSALAAASRAPGPTAPPPLSTSAPPVRPPAAPEHSGDAGGGHGWGIRPHRQSPPGSWVMPPPSMPTSAVAAPGPAAAARYVPGFALPPPPWEEGPARSSAGLQVFVVLLLAAMVAAGLLLYLSGGLNQGLGSGTHTLSTPSTLDGLAQDSASQLQSVGQTLQANIEASDTSTHTLQQMVTAFYGSPAVGSTAATPSYFLSMLSFGAPLTSTDLTDLGSLATVTTVETVNGVGFHCGTPAGGSMGSLCFWIDGNVMGVVEGATAVGPAGTLAAAEEARSSGER